MELFRMTLGVWNYDELRSHSYYNLLSLLFFVLFLILVPILLLNMLIAMMGNTYSEIIGKSEREFALQWANILVEIERGLPKKEARNFVDQYTIVSKDADNPKTTLMVSMKDVFLMKDVSSLIPLIINFVCTEFVYSQLEGVLR